MYLLLKSHDFKLENNVKIMSLKPGPHIKRLALHPLAPLVVTSVMPLKV